MRAEMMFSPSAERNDSICLYSAMDKARHADTATKPGILFRCTLLSFIRIQNQSSREKNMLLIEEQHPLHTGATTNAPVLRVIKSLEALFNAVCSLRVLWEV